MQIQNPLLCYTDPVCKVQTAVQLSCGSVLTLNVKCHMLGVQDLGSIQGILSSSNRSVFPQLTKMNVEAQRVERELRDELANSISKTVSDADRARITELEKTDAELRIEVSKYVWQSVGKDWSLRFLSWNIHFVINCIYYPRITWEVN